MQVKGEAENKVWLGAYAVQLEDIDRAVLAASSQVQQAATVVRRSPTGEDRLVAYISPGEVDLFTLDLELRKRLPAHLVPALFQPLRRLPTGAHPSQAGLPLLVFLKVNMTSPMYSIMREGHRLGGHCLPKKHVHCWYHCLGVLAPHLVLLDTCSKTSTG